jgi:transcriptional regulator with XRE-family HTH domain
VADYESSGLTRHDFCVRAGISISTLDSWRRKVREQGTPRIVPVRIESREPAGNGGAGFRLSLLNGLYVEGGWDFPEQGLARLLRVAAEQ